LASVELYDTTLRDGAQSEGISFSVVDKLHIVQKLDELGIHYIEGGWPGANPKDAEFYQRAKGLKLKNAHIVAFGSTRRANVKAEDDNFLVELVKANVKYATLVAKSSDLHVERVLKTTPEENLAMIADSIKYLKSKGINVLLDAEHFFDGYKHNPQYALKTLEVAAEAGAICLVLCDTNGGMLPEDIVEATKAALKIGKPLGIHTHNDGGLAVANTLAAVKTGAVHVQGTINGLGERTGNADLCTIIPALKLKMNINCISDAQLASVTEAAHYVSELTLPPTPLPLMWAPALLVIRQATIWTALLSGRMPTSISTLLKWATKCAPSFPTSQANATSLPRLKNWALIYQTPKKKSKC
jgi:2-isopropylmalate synthase